MRFLITILAVLIAPFTFAQFGISGGSNGMKSPVRWELKAENVTAERADIVLTAYVESGWHMYSPKHAPFPLKIVFKKNDNYQKEGKLIAPATYDYTDEYIGPSSYYKVNPVVFKQTIKRLTAVPFDLQITVEGQACQDDGVCLPFAPPALKVKVGDGMVPVDTATLQPVSPQNSSTASTNDADGDGVTDSLDKCPDVSGKLPSGCPEVTMEAGNVPMPQRYSQEAIAAISSEGDCATIDYVPDDKSYWAIFIGGFIGGLLALLTPCVFPMIPLTVSFFTKQSKNKVAGIRNAWLYGLSIIAIYTGVGFLITRIFGSDALNAMSSSAFWNLLFFGLFTVFAISFLGVFEITLPSAFVNKMDAQSNKGGLIGIFFMAFTLSLVSFSCTGPIIGTLLVEAAYGGSTVGPIVGMLGFSLALALPFGLFAAFPGWLNSLPKSGGWLNEVKVTLGLLELALALKFLSNVDLAYHWGLLTREIFLVLWIVIFSTLGFYVLGKLRMAHDSDVKRANVFRLFVSIFSFAFALYMLPGLFGAPLKLLSGLAPPSNYREWNPSECPHDLSCYHDYEKGMQAAIQERKPILLDFTGYACVNCRKMEDNVWSSPRILPIIRDEYILISLYVDDKSPLPANLRRPSRLNGEELTTYGALWSEFEAYYYGKNSQPLYVLLDLNGNLLSNFYEFDTDVEKYRQFLEQGLCRFNSRLNEGAF